MAYGLYISAEGALAQQTRLEALSNNLANVNTTGFKRDLALFQARYAEATERGQDYPGSHSINDIGGGVIVRETKTDHSPGPVKRSNIDSDMAIQGDGYFVVKRGGQNLLTRAGNFMFTADGQLTTQDGYPVLSEDGDAVKIDPNLPWSATSTGAIAQNNAEINLALVRVPSPGDLAKAADNLFAPLSTPKALGREERKVLPGHIEMSDVKPTMEMMDLIETSRVFEANVNMIKNHDQMMGNLVERVLKSS
jgi:flagellar basal-body rod protein FlgF